MTLYVQDNNILVEPVDAVERTQSGLTISANSKTQKKGVIVAAGTKAGHSIGGTVIYKEGYPVTVGGKTYQLVRPYSVLVVYYEQEKETTQPT